MTTAPATGRGLAVAAAWLLSTVLLTGCSMPRLAYNQADWLLLKRLDNYLDLTDFQQERAREALDVAHQRHRQSVLPAFADAFTDAAARVRRGFGEADARHVVATARTLVAASLDVVLPPLSAALADLSPEQLTHLAERLAERNEEHAEKHWLNRPQAERLERRAERTVERIEEWTGPLTEAQVDLVRAARDAMPDRGAEWLVHRRAQQNRLMALLANRAPPADVAAFLREWWSLQEDLPAHLARAREAHVAGYVALAVRLAATLDDAQRERLAARLDDLARDARELAASR